MRQTLHISRLLPPYAAWRAAAGRPYLGARGPPLAEPVGRTLRSGVFDIESACTARQTSYFTGHRAHRFYYTAPLYRNLRLRYPGPLTLPVPRHLTSHFFLYVFVFETRPAQPQEPLAPRCQPFVCNATHSLKEAKPLAVLALLVDSNSRLPLRGVACGVSARDLRSLSA